MIPLDKNETYWLLTDDLLKQVQQFSQKEFSTYPAYTELKSAIAEYAGVDPDWIFLAPGSDAAIQAIAYAFVGNDGTALLPVPTFYGYESILERVGAKIEPLPYREEHNQFLFPYDEAIEALGKVPKALFLCHPNNPLGCPIEEKDLEALLAASSLDTYIVSDEAYYEFSGRTLLPFIHKHPNLIIVRTLSKGFALSGARVGYGIAHPEVIKILERFMLPWPIAHLSAHSAIILLSLEPEVRARRDLVITQRERFSKALQAIPGTMIYASETNFILLRVAHAEAEQSKLKDDGILVALGERMSRFPEAKTLLRDTLRIAIPSPEDSDRVVKALERGMAL